MSKLKVGDLVLIRKDATTSSQRGSWYKQHGRTLVVVVKDGLIPPPGVEAPVLVAPANAKDSGQIVIDESSLVLLEAIDWQPGQLCAIKKGVDVSYTKSRAATWQAAETMLEVVQAPAGGYAVVKRRREMDAHGVLVHQDHLYRWPTHSTMSEHSNTDQGPVATATTAEASPATDQRPDTMYAATLLESVEKLKTEVDELTDKNSRLQGTVRRLETEKRRAEDRIEDCKKAKQDWQQEATKQRQTANYYRQQLADAHAVLGRVVHQNSERWDSVNLTEHFPTDNRHRKRSPSNPTGESK